MPDMILLEAEEKMDKSILSYNHELSTIRTGRANPSLLDSIMIEYYGVLSPLKQISAISVPEPSQLYIKPFDKSTLKAIEAAIGASSLGLTPQSDGVGIRLNIPKMTEDRRKELVKQLGKIEENSKVAIRNIRRDANEDLKKLGTLPEDEEKSYLEEVQKLTDKKIIEIESLTAEKQKELLTI